MSLALLGLSAGFILVLAILFYLLISTDLKIYKKFMAVFIVAVFYIVQYESLQQYTGWPTSDELPDKFVLIAADVHEPNQKTGEQGVMYWWIRDSVKRDQPPRVFQLPYKSELHKKGEQVIQEQKKGSQYVARKTGGSSSRTGLGVSFEKIRKSDHQKK